MISYYRRLIDEILDKDVQADMKYFKVTRIKRKASVRVLRFPEVRNLYT